MTENGETTTDKGSNKRSSSFGLPGAPMVDKSTQVSMLLRQDSMARRFVPPLR